jgi:hypothetical protein
MQMMKKCKEVIRAGLLKESQRSPRDLSSTTAQFATDCLTEEMT